MLCRKKINNNKDKKKKMAVNELKSGLGILDDIS